MDDLGVRDRAEWLKKSSTFLPVLRETFFCPNLSSGISFLSAFDPLLDNAVQSSRLGTRAARKRAVFDASNPSRERINLYYFVSSLIDHWTSPYNLPGPKRALRKQGLFRDISPPHLRD